MSEELENLFRKYPTDDLALIYPKTLQLYVDRKKAAFSSWYEFFPRSTASEPGTHGTFKHPRKTALDLYAETAEIYCTCDAAQDQLNLTVTVSDSGQISVLPEEQPPYFVWEETTVQRVVQ